METADSSGDGSALDLFADWLSQREKGVLVEFETLVQKHPGHAAELVELHATWKRLAAASDPANSSLHERIQGRFGAQTVPMVSLPEREANEMGSAASSALIAQLAAPGSRFGRYKIRGEVARGGMGAILRIWDEDLRRHLAMKVILGQAEVRPSSKTPPVELSKITRFLEEAQVTGQLDHPGIVPVHELGLDPEGRLYFTMKLVKGESLHTIFERVRECKDGWTQTRALNVLLKVCEAMAYAHDKGVIHRDLKPANVMVGRFGEVHVMDWGLARIEGQKDKKDIRIRAEHPLTAELQGVRGDKRGAAPDSPLFTMDGDVVGTPAYMPPEQAAGKVDEVGPHSDVYALGAMLYHLLAGHPPYLAPGIRLNNYVVWARVQEGPPRPIEELAPDIPPELAAICNRAMAREWKQRYHDMSELAEDLSAYLNQRVVRAYETGAWAETKKWLERNKALAASLATVVLALVTGLIVSLSLKGEAVASAKEAKRQETIATRNAGLAEDRRLTAEASEGVAKEQKELAESQKANVLRLSALQTLDDLVKEADELWPPVPEMVERLETWIGRAEALLEKVPEFRESLAQLEQRAPPQTAEARAAEQRSHPRYAELESAKHAAEMFARLMGEMDWPSEASVEAKLKLEPLPEDAEGLNRLAWSMLEGEQPVFDSEMKAVVLARRAVALATEPEQRAGIRETLANALARVGQFKEALNEERLALAEAGDGKRHAFEKGVREYESAVELFGRPDPTLLIRARTNATRLATELEAEVTARRTWNFATEDDRWWHAQMEKLLAGLESFGNGREGPWKGVTPHYGWGVAKRLAFAASVEKRSVSGPEAAVRWAEAIEAIARSEKYRGMHWPGGDRLTPQLGLLPIGADPDSGLWEFSHLATSEDFEPAARGADGKLVLRESTGLVFVLIPGGSFSMGAQSKDPNGPNYDPQAQENESPVRKELLQPYFLSKFEMTQGQWLRMTASNPSQFREASYINGWNRELKTWTALQPVNCVGWIECTTLMRRLGLLLPTEAQWEWACRAGTSSVYSSGNEPETLREVGNVADSFAMLHGADSSWTANFEEWDDGNTCLAPVGSYRANDFGLHDMHGNLSEWCRDVFAEDGYIWPTFGADAQRQTLGSAESGRNVVVRGGDYGSEASRVRSAARGSAVAGMVSFMTIGLRPSRLLTP